MAVTGGTAGSETDQLACYCCGVLLPAADLTRFEQHPQHGVCAVCALWLHSRSRPSPEKESPPVWRRV